MAWQSPTKAIPYTGSGTAVFEAPVSPTTAPTQDPVSPLRMFFGDRAGLSTGGQDLVFSTDVTGAGLAPAADVFAYVSFIDSDAEGEFATDDTRRSSTWVANEHNPEKWTLERIVSYNPFLTELDTITSGECLYAEPCVVEVPEDLGGGWLMLLSRRRQITQLETGQTAYEDPEDDSEPIQHKYICDIVCYWSNSLNFAGPGSSDIRGPVLLVDSLEALPDGNFRVFTGVPSANFAEDSSAETRLLKDCLYVYYAVELPEAAHLTCEDEGLRDAITSSDYALLFDQDGVDPVTPRGFIAVKRIPWYFMAKALRLSFRRGPFTITWSDTFWTDEPSWTRDTAVPGELLGRVRIWIPTVAGATPGEEVREFLSRNYDGEPLIQRMTDPEVELCEDGFALFFRGLHWPPAAATDALELDWVRGYGVWRASSIPDAQDLYTLDDDLDPRFVSTHRVAVFGVDFALAYADGDNPGPDLVSGATNLNADLEARLDPADPDVVRWRSAAGKVWYAYLGGNAVLDLSVVPTKDKYAFLSRVVGTDDDGCRLWEEAWSYPDTVGE